MCSNIKIHGSKMFGFMSFLLTVYKMIIQLMTMMFQARNALSDDLVTPKKKKNNPKKNIPH